MPPCRFPTLMDWLQQLDVSLFRFVNLTLRTGWLDAVMPFFNWNALFIPVVAAVALWLLIKGGTRGRLFILVLALGVALTDGVVCYHLKSAIGRPRPFNDIQDAHVLIRRGGNGSMPSSHAANWFAGIAITFIYYRRQWWWLLIPAFVVCFGRIYNGVHYPGDVLAGALIGAITGCFTAWALDQLWGTLGRKFFPLAWASLPSLMPPETKGKTPHASAPGSRRQ